MNEAEKKYYLDLARKTISSSFEGTKPSRDDMPDSGKVKCGAFVTLTIRDRLRGCIGTFDQSRDLWTVITTMAESAAFHDPRFKPLKKEELKNLELEISVLTPKVTIAKISEIEIGTHGLVVTKGWNSGVLLPQVATEYGWHPDQFLSHTCMKAGLDENSWQPLGEDGSFPKGLKVETFTAEIFNDKKA